MIRALSPYYITTNLTYITSSSRVCDKYTLNIQVWDGLSTGYNGSNVELYQITFNNTQADPTTHDININAIIQDYIEFQQPFPNPNDTTQLIDGNNQRWVRTFNTYDGGTAEYNSFQDYMTLGYAYGNEGKNYDDVTDGLLLKAQDYKVSRNGFFVVPIEASIGNTISVTVKSSPDLQLNDLFYIPQTSYSNRMVQYLWVDLNDTSDDEFVTVEVTNGTTGASSTTILDVVNECKYTPLDVMFQNKDGAIQLFTFFKKQEESITITDNHFETNRGQASVGFHQFVRHNVQARTMISAETGFIDEDNNEVLKQMLLSERIWSYTDGVPTPLNIVDKSFKYKTRQNERLVSYTVKFEKSYNEINNI
tara:strand:+ start:1796 stop:2887 length:1092 start_codon:yes stop_codon:yes gene_type:complete